MLSQKLFALLSKENNIYEKLLKDPTLASKVFENMKNRRLQFPSEYKAIFIVCIRNCNKLVKYSLYLII